MSTPWDMGLLGGISEAVRFIETCRSSLASSGLRGLFVLRRKLGARKSVEKAISRNKLYNKAARMEP